MAAMKKATAAAMAIHDDYGNNSWLEKIIHIFICLSY